VFETATNFLQSKYNIFRRLSKTSLYYHVKHGSLKMLQLVYHFYDIAVNTSPFFNFFKHLKKHITLFLCLLPTAHTSHEFTTLRNCWTCGTGLQQSAVDSAIDGERIFAPAYENILSSDNMLIEW